MCNVLCDACELAASVCMCVMLGVGGSGWAKNKAAFGASLARECVANTERTHTHVYAIYTARFNTGNCMRIGNSQGRRGRLQHEDGPDVLYI